ncbi:MAG: hypothetical protein U0359_32285 [Byssovorax sp.]
MKSDLSSRAGAHPSIVLAAVLEPLVSGRRVAVLGDATTGLAVELGERGARLVHAYDPDPARAAEALAKVSPGRHSPVSYARLTDDLGVRDGAFDVVIVPDLALFADPADVLRKTRKLCAPAGAAVVGARNTKAEGRRLLAAREGAAASTPPSYYELYDLVSLQFAKVRMVGQAPFVGYTVADFAAGDDLSVSVDTSLLTASEEPEHFLAIASDRSVAFEAYTVVGLPWPEVAQGLAAGAGEARRDDERLALTEAQTKILVLTAELEQLRDRQRSETEARAGTSAALSARVVELEQEIAGREGRLRETEGRAGDNHVRAERLAHQIRDLEEELRRQRERGTRLTKQLDDEKRARTKAEVELGMIRGRVSSPPEAAPVAPVAAAQPAPAAVTQSAVTQSAADRDRETALQTELATARLRIEALAAELELCRGRISELEQETAETKRRATVEPPPAAPDPKLLHRLNELEAAVTAALREAETANHAREAAYERARRAEARSQRMLELEAALMTAEAARLEQVEQVQKLEARIAAGDPRVAELERRLGDREQRLADGRGKIAELTRALEEAKAGAAEAERRLDAAGLARDEAKARLAEAEAEIVAIATKLAEAERRAGDLDEARAQAEAASAEIAALEAALRERGQLVAARERELAEAERVGRELIAELAQARAREAERPEAAPAPGASVSQASQVEDLRARLDALAQSAARTEADLQAAGWKIAHLERALAEAGEGARPASVVERELGAALVRARDELAALRRATGAT